MGEPPSEIDLQKESEISPETDLVFKFRDEVERRLTLIANQEVQKTENEEKKSVVFIPHSGMDRDALFSAVAYCEILRMKYPNLDIKVITPDEETNRKSSKLTKELEENGVQWNKEDSFTTEANKASLVIMVDNYEYPSAGLSSKEGEHMMAEGKLMILDHHKTRLEDENKYIEPEAKSTCELVIRMYKGYIDQKLARKLALGILSDSGKLAFIRRENKRSMETYQYVLNLSGATTTELVNELPHFSIEELAPLLETQTPLVIPGVDDEIVMFLQTKVSTTDISEKATEVLDGAIKIRPIEEIGDEMTVEEKAAESKKADFSIFVNMIDRSEKTKRICVGIKMRSNTLPIVLEIGLQGGRGGNLYAGYWEYWLTDDEIMDWAKSSGEDGKKFDFVIREKAIEKFKESYAKIRKAYDLRIKLMDKYDLSEEQRKEFIDTAINRWSEINDSEGLEEFDSHYSYKWRKNMKNVDIQFGQAYDEYSEFVDKIR